jgi:hypothetical protein
MPSPVTESSPILKVQTTENKNFKTALRCTHKKHRKTTLTITSQLKRQIFIVCASICQPLSISVSSPGRGKAEESVGAGELLSLGGQAHGHVRAVHVLRVHQLLAPLVVLPLHRRKKLTTKNTIQISLQCFQTRRNYRFLKVLDGVAVCHRSFKRAESASHVIHGGSLKR